MGETPRLSRPVLLGAFALSGAAALSYEVIWTRSLSVVLGSTTYAISSMLATFMLGLAIGGIAGGRIGDGERSCVVWLGAVELGIGALGIASHLVIQALPALYLSVFRSFHASAPLFFAFQIVLCALVMLLPTVLMGMTFPLVTRVALTGDAAIGRTIGEAYGANTMGAVLGSITTGFLLIPGVGLRGSTLVAAGANAAVAAAILGLAGGKRGRRMLLLAIAYLPLGALAARAEPPWALVNYYSAHHYLDGQSFGMISASYRVMFHKLYERDGLDGHVSAFRSRDGRLMLEVGGKIEGTTALDVANALSLAFLPAAAHPSPRRMLVIGLGAGVTLEAARRAVADVELAEISGGVLEAVRRHGPPGVLDGIVTHRDDARNLLLRSDERWDIISSEPSYPTDFAVANLFTREYYALAAARLMPGGIFCQWLPYHMLTNDDVTMMVKTFASAFPHASLWKVPGSMDLLLLGSTSPFARSTGEILERTRALHGDQPFDLELSRAPEAVAAIALRPEVAVNTDDRPVLEFHVARNFRVAHLATLER